MKARFLVKEIYLLTEKLPDSERFNLICQLQRAAISIPTNIAEGAGRSTDNDFLRFFDVALGSSFETETEIILALDLGYIDVEYYSTITEQVQEIQKIINEFRQRLIG